MRIVVWNANGGFHKKAHALAALEPDIAVISECARPALIRQKTPGFTPTSAHWAGKNPNRGLAVFSFGNWNLEQLAADDDIHFALPVQVTGQIRFGLVGVWAQSQHYYVGPTLDAVRRYSDLVKSSSAVFAGDLNHNVRWDKPRKRFKHADSVAALEQLGLVSLYHYTRQVPQGCEPEPTLYWRDRRSDGPTYHIDYCFASRSFISPSLSVQVGSFQGWVAAGLSDHAPLIVDF